MNDAWKIHAEAATADLTAARRAKKEQEAIEHLTDAAENIRLAIEVLERDQ